MRHGVSKKKEDERIVRCPTCGGDSIYAERNPFRPFCSARCKGIDFGAWATEEFRMPAETPPDDEPFGDPKLQQ
ncbi:DNA gyrase inhibitor YacG [Acidovorax cavernicola]|uniref:DNA gyrase inhibitor YacG n=1 Tax=Acidovorax cavernicola TaxID=1675792 RepID=A0A9X8D283_9BURK|nr:DNA gyrase inhibitor YacG [Acidovorax cavernicola]RIX76624.1 DNA gyrase inhibitor YacG [Acidovorax cavernicola]